MSMIKPVSASSAQNSGQTTGNPIQQLAANWGFKYTQNFSPGDKQVQDSGIFDVAVNNLISGVDLECKDIIEGRLEFMPFALYTWPASLNESAIVSLGMPLPRLWPSLLIKSKLSDNRPNLNMLSDIRRPFDKRVDDSLANYEVYAQEPFAQELIQLILPAFNHQAAQKNINCDLMIVNDTVNFNLSTPAIDTRSAYEQLYAFASGFITSIGETIISESHFPEVNTRENQDAMWSLERPAPLSSDATNKTLTTEATSNSYPAPGLKIRFSEWLRHYTPYVIIALVFSIPILIYLTLRWLATN